MFYKMYNPPTPPKGKPQSNGGEAPAEAVVAEGELIAEEGVATETAAVETVAAGEEAVVEVEQEVVLAQDEVAGEIVNGEAAEPVLEQEVISTEVVDEPIPVQAEVLAIEGGDVVVEAEEATAVSGE